MKKHICTLISVLLSISICGCSHNNTNISNSNISLEQNKDFNSNSKQEESIGKLITFTTPYDITECYLGNFIATTNDGRLYGMLDSNGNVVIDFTYDNLTFSTQDSGIRRENIIYATTEYGKGIIDFKGNTLVPFEFDWIQGYDKYSNYTFAKINNSTYIISDNYKKSEINISPDSSIRQLGSNCFLVSKSIYEHSIYNMNGEVITTITNAQGLPLYIKQVSEDYICVQNPTVKDGIYSANISFYDNNFDLCSTIENNELHPTEFAISEYVSEKIGVGKLLYDEKVLVDYSTGKIITQEYKNIGKFYDGKAFAIDKNSSLYVIDSNGIVTNDYSHIEAFKTTSNVAVSSNSGTYRLYNKKGNDIFNERFYSVDSTNEYLLVENLDGKYAFINGYGDIIFDFGTITDSTINGFTKSKEFFEDDMYCAIVDKGETYSVYAYII